MLLSQKIGPRHPSPKCIIESRISPQQTKRPSNHTLKQVHRNVSVVMVVMSKKFDCFQWEKWAEFTYNGYLAFDFSEMSLLTQVICG